MKISMLKSVMMIIVFCLLAGMLILSTASAGTLTVGSWMTAYKNIDITGYGGAFTGTIPITFNGQPFTVVCCEIEQDIHFNTSYDNYTMQVINGQAAWIVSNYLNNSLSNDEAAALQLSVWELIKENPINGYSLDNGDFQASGGNYTPEVAVLASNYLISSIGKNGIAYLFHNDSYQDELAPVPEPGSLLVLGCGLISLAGLVTRRRRA
jgi:hypothetical protein